MKKFSLLLVILFLLSAFLLAKIAQAGSGDNLSGWAWSENIGWISFNSTNCDVDDNGYIDSGACGGDNSTTPVIDYGVNIDESTGVFSGYAWSSGTHIGAITFNTGELGGCPSGACEVKIDFGNGDVSGWARACSVFQNPNICSGAVDPNRGGWDGWIKLKGTDYGVWLNTFGGSLPINQFFGWAWGGDPESDDEAVIGWISFNCFNSLICGQSDYQVVYTSVNQKPYIEPGSLIISLPAPDCTKTPDILFSIQWTYKDDDGDNQSQYHLQVATDSGFTNKFVDVIAPQSVSPGGTGTSGVVVTVEPSPETSLPEFDINYRGPGAIYYWRLRVQDSKGAWSHSQGSGEQGTSFDTPSNALPSPEFTISNTQPEIGEEVTFTDGTGNGTWDFSDCWYSSNNKYDCKDDTDNRYIWDFDTGDGVIDCNTDLDPDCLDGQNFDRVNGTITHTYPIQGDFTVMLKIRDNFYRNMTGKNHDGECEAFVGVYQKSPKPEWKEIPPFGWLLNGIKNIFANISNFFKNIFKILT